MSAVLTHRKKAKISLTLLGVFGMLALCLVYDCLDVLTRFLAILWNKLM